MKKVSISLIILAAFLCFSREGHTQMHNFVGCVADIPQCGEICGVNHRMTVIFDDLQCQANPGKPNSCYCNS